MVRRTEWPLPPLCRREARHAGGQQRCRGQRFFIGHRRQQARQARCQPRLAGAWRSHHQNMMAAGRRDHQRSPCPALADYVGHVGARRGSRGGELGGDDGCKPPVRHTRQMGAERGQVGCAVDVHARHKRCLGRAGRRQIELGGLLGALGRGWPQHRKRAGRLGICVHPGDHIRPSFAPRLCRMTSRCPAGHRERTTHRPQRPRQRQLAGKFPIHQRFHRDLSARGQNAQRNRQIKAARLLRQVGRGEIG